MDNGHRSKNFSFKRAGENRNYDIVFSFLNMFSRGATELVVMAVMEFLKNHAGQTIQIGTQKVLIPEFSDTDQIFIVERTKPKRRTKTAAPEPVEAESHAFVSAPSIAAFSDQPTSNPTSFPSEEPDRQMFHTQDEEDTDAFCTSIFNTLLGN